MSTPNIRYSEEYPFHVTRWNIPALWAYNTSTTICAICRNHLTECCIECHASEKKECSVAWGACKHAFHAHCIERWLKQREICPLDNRPWQSET